MQLYLGEAEKASELCFVELGGGTGGEGDAICAEGIEGPRVALLAD